MLARYLFATLLFLSFSCNYHRFDKDKRQLAAKDEISNKIPRARLFDIIHFREDTLLNYPDSIFKRPIRYTLDFVYKDSANTMQRKRGVVLFTPDGRSIITSRIIDSAQ